MSMDGVTMKDKCERLEPCGEKKEQAMQLQTAHVYVRRVIHVIVHNGLTVVEGVLVVVHTFTWPFVTVIRP